MKKYLFKFKGLLAINIVFIIAEAIVSVSFAFVLKIIIDAGVNRSMTELKKSLMITGAFVIVMFLVEALTKLFQAKFIQKTVFELKKDMFSSILKRDIKSFNGENTAQYISTLTNDINIVEQDYFINILGFINNVIAFTLATIAIIKINIYITMGVFIVGAITMTVPILFGKNLGRRKKLYSDNLGVFTTKIKDIFSGFEVIKSFNIEEKISKEYDKSNYEVEKSKYKSSVLSSFVDVLSMDMGFLMFLISLAIGAYFVIKGEMTVGAMTAAVQLMNNIVNPIINISSRINKLKAVSGIEEKIVKFIGDKNEIDEGLEKLSFNDKISFKDIHFSYNDDKKILKGLSFDIKKGGKYAIVGGSGSGKSTVLKLLLRYYDNYQGSITIDGEDNRNIRVSNLYNLVSVIQQNVFMFDSNIKDNITLFQNYSEIEIERAVRMAGLENLINSLPNNIESAVGENGCNLSGGEKQRVAIARALIKNTPVLVIDEATSALDNETSYSIEKSILSLKEQTCLVITHKLMEETLKKYDGIIVIKNGKLVEMGSFDDLMMDRGYFYSLYNVAEAS